VDDGRLDLVAVRAAAWWRIAALVPRLFLGTIDRSPLVERIGGACFTLERPAGGLIHTDGETHLAGPRVVVTVRPRSLRLVVPAGVRAAAPERTGGAVALPTHA
jgi:diacylglycerol kinase family enzyme